MPEWVENIIFPIMKKLPVQFILAATVIIVAVWCLMQAKTKELLYGPVWGYIYDMEAETAVFYTETKLKSGEVTVRFQLEFKYRDVIFYILEVQGIYDRNQISLNNSDVSNLDDGDDKKGTQLCFTITKQQKDNLDALVTEIEKILKEILETEYSDNFNAAELEINERQIAEIRYQSLDMNKSRLMYISVSEEEISTIKKSEVVIRSPDLLINLDEVNLEESFYSNQAVLDIIGAFRKRVEL